MLVQHVTCKCGVSFTLTDEILSRIINDGSDIKKLDNDMYEFKCFNPKCNEMLRVEFRQEGK